MCMETIIAGIRYAYTPGVVWVKVVVVVGWLAGRGRKEKKESAAQPRLNHFARELRPNPMLTPLLLVERERAECVAGGGCGHE